MSSYSMTESLSLVRSGFSGALADYAELFKLRITALIVMTAWAGYYLAALKAHAPLLSQGLFDALLGIGLVSAGTAGLNEAIEYRSDALMQRTARRPLPANRMPVAQAALLSIFIVLGGSFYMALTLNILAGTLTFLTAIAYLAIYTPLKKHHPVCTLIGAIPGAMPGLLGWVAVRGRIEWEAVVLFAILFFWQFPHFLAIAWLYREDYDRAGIQMRPVVEPDGRSTASEILLYSAGLVPVSLAPTLLHMAGWSYGVGAVLLGIALFLVGLRLWRAALPATSSQSKRYARQLLQATVFYLPLLLALMMLNAKHF
jgi:protoheme IX farnesyltransferase